MKMFLSVAPMSVWALQATDHSHALRFTAYEKAAPPNEAAPAAAASASTGAGGFMLPSHCAKTYSDVNRLE